MTDHPTLSSARTAADIIEATVRREWWLANDGAEYAGEVPTEEDLAAWSPGCPGAAQAGSAELAAACGLIGPDSTPPHIPADAWRWQAMGDPEARKAMVAELRESIGPGADFDGIVAILESYGAIVMRPRLVFIAPLRIDASGAFEPGAAGGGVGAGRSASALARHPGGGPAPASDRTPGGGVARPWEGAGAAPSLRHQLCGDYSACALSGVLDLASFGMIEAVEVDREPLVSRTATAAALCSGRHYRREPVQGELIPAPRTLQGSPVGDVVLHTLSRFPLTGDERNPIRGDIYLLALMAFALDGPMAVSPELGALLVGGRDTPANRARWWAATDSLHGLKITVDKRSGEFRNLAVVDVESTGIAHVAPPAWWREKEGPLKWRLAGGLFRPMLMGGKAGRGTAAGYWGALARTIASIEAVLSYGPTAGAGKDGRISDYLRPETGKRGPGPWLFVEWHKVLSLSGEHVTAAASGKDSRETKRWQRRRDALESAGYVPPNGRGEAEAGDTIEVRPQRGGRTGKAGLWVRASERFVEAVRKSRRSEWTRIPAARLFQRGE